MTLNACELKIDLFCRGIRVSPGVSLAGSRSIARTRAGLGSGLEIALPAPLAKHEIWVNVPVAESFAQASPYALTRSGARYAIVDDRDGTRYPIRLPREPAWYARQTSNDVPMNRIGVMQGTYLGIYVNPVCAFWNYSPPQNCGFCTTGQNVGVAEASVKTVEDVVETCWAAKAESGITFVHLNGGFQGSRGLAFIAPYVKAIKQKVGLLVGVQLAPETDFSRYDELIALGADHLSFCVELLDPAWFARICPGKARTHGQSLYFDAMRYCARKMPAGAVSGEIIAGLEPIANTLAAIEDITAIGAFPTVCIFRPTIGSDLEHWPSPEYAEMRQVMTQLYDACRRHWLPIGAAPNIGVSLVVTADEAALLAEHRGSFYAYETYRWLARTIGAPMFRHRMRAS